ncbi:hypothetical protein CCGE531_16615 [Rhizobium sp. CCGE531]|nr:hypothetical protein CCGE531_16615 [Rhizobium sp. CCGE531]AYG73861.1 hypothetical protein CCGE532_16120 [Rhizobium sp. CCGE532]
MRASFQRVGSADHSAAIMASVDDNIIRRSDHDEHLVRCSKVKGTDVAEAANGRQITVIGLI